MDEERIIREAGKKSGLIMFRCLIISLLLLLSMGAVRVEAQLVPSERTESKAIHNLLDLFEKAFIEEDIDMLDNIIYKDFGFGIADFGFLKLGREAFIKGMTWEFRRYAYTNMKITDREIKISDSRIMVNPVRRFGRGFKPLPNHSFRKSSSPPLRTEPSNGVKARLTRSFEDHDSNSLLNRTQSFEVLFSIKKGIDELGIITFTLDSLSVGATSFEVSNPGIGRPGEEMLVKVSGLEGMENPVVSGDILLPSTVFNSKLIIVDESTLSGKIIAPPEPGRQKLQVTLNMANGESVTIEHLFRVRSFNDGELSGFNRGIGFPSLCQDKYGTLLFGSDSRGWVFYSTDGGVTIGRVNVLKESGTENQPNWDTQIVDIIADSQGRLYFMFISREEAGGISNAGGIVFDGRFFNRVIHPLDGDYPFFDLDGKRSPVLRGLVAPDDSIWLFGSDGGAANFAPEREKRYSPLLTRDNSGLLSNIVPTITMDVTGNLWFGTIFGISQWDGKSFTNFHFDPDLVIGAKVDTLERLYEEIAKAIFEATPIASLGLGRISFLEEFGAPLVKEDINFSSAVDSKGRIWFGTLGGGVRIYDQGKFSQLRYSDGLVSNTIFSIAIDLDGDVWLATEQGVTRVKERDGKFVFMHITPLDGLAIPVRDVMVDRNGVKWFATDRGIYRYSGD